MVAKFKRNRKRQTEKSIFFSALLAVCLILIIGFLGINNWEIRQRRVKLTAQIDALKKEIADSEQKNKELKEDISQAGSPEYLEKVAREKLGMKAPGEQVVVITKESEVEQKPSEQKASFWKWNPSNWWQWLKSEF